MSDYAYCGSRILDSQVNNSDIAGPTSHGIEEAELEPQRRETLLPKRANCG